MYSCLLRKFDILENEYLWTQNNNKANQIKFPLTTRARFLGDFSDPGFGSNQLLVSLFHLIVYVVDQI